MVGDNDRIDRVSTGLPTLDDILCGGLPVQRTFLLTGTPGTGKSTLAMQFLQTGLERGERCLFVSTEQTEAEIRDGFAPFSFDLDHEELAITSLQALPERTETGDRRLRMQTLGEGGPLSDARVAFTVDNLVEYLKAGGPADRVVVDSVSGLDILADDERLFRRSVLRLIRLFTDEFGATTLFTAESRDAGSRAGVEELAPGDALQYQTHGVIRVWREAVDGEYHRFLDVMKMRGIDHDTRKYEIAFDDDGMHGIPRKRAHSEAFIDHDQHPTGIPGLDELLGGGLLKGTGTLIEHDGRANIDAMLAAIISGAIDEGMSVSLVPTVDMDWERLDALLGGDHPVGRLMGEDRLFVLDFVGTWDSGHKNVLSFQGADAGMRYLLDEIDGRHTGDGLLSIVNTEMKTHTLDDKASRRIRYWQEANRIGQDDVLIDIHNPKLMPQDLAEFHIDAAGQVLRTWLDDAGLQYVQLKTSPTGHVGSSGIVEYIDEEPYVRVEPP